MTTLFVSPNIGSPGTHVLAIGVGNYGLKFFSHWSQLQDSNLRLADYKSARLVPLPGTINRRFSARLANHMEMTTSVIFLNREEP